MQTDEVRAESDVRAVEDAKGVTEMTSPQDSGGGLARKPLDQTGRCLEDCLDLVVLLEVGEEEVDRVSLSDDDGDGGMVVPDHLVGLDHLRGPIRDDQGDGTVSEPLLDLAEGLIDETSDESEKGRERSSKGRVSDRVVR